MHKKISKDLAKGIFVAKFLHNFFAKILHKSFLRGTCTKKGTGVSVRKGRHCCVWVASVSCLDEAIDPEEVVVVNKEQVIETMQG